MNSKIYFLLIVSLLFTSTAIGQKNDPVIATIGGVPVLQSEFEYAYNKDALINIENRQTKEQFLDAYLNSKLNTIEARSKGIDKTTAFRKEYTNSIDLMMDAYTKDSIFNNDWIKKVYRRAGENIEVLNIFIPFSKSGYIYPSDTLSTYETATDLRKIIKNDGTNFEESIQQYLSANPSNTNSIILGQKSWITSMMTDENYENQVYQLGINNVSEPIRTRYGYYIVKVLNRRPDQGIVRVSDIYLKYPQNATNNQKDSVNELASVVYGKLINGADFDELYQQYTSDFDIEAKGDLGFFGIRRPINTSFQEAIDKVPVGGYTKPFLFADGLHIVKVTDIRYITSFGEMKKDIVNRLNNADFRNRFYVHENEAAKEKIPYSIESYAYNELLEIANQNNFCENDFENINLSTASKILVVIGDKKYTIGDFLAFFKNNRKDICSIYTLSSDILYYGVNSYLFNLLKEENKERLLENDPQLINIAKEYYDGILYFNIMSDELWDKARTDEQGLNRFYENHKAKYKWNSPRYDGYLIFAKNENIKKEAEAILKRDGGNRNLASLLKEKLNTKEDVNIIVEKGFWSKGENQYIDALLYGVPTSKTFIGYPVYFFEGQKIEQPRNMDDVRGLVVTDYQSDLDKEWIANLRKKYDIVINKNALDRISTK